MPSSGEGRDYPLSAGLAAEQTRVLLGLAAMYDHRRYHLRGYCRRGGYERLRETLGLCADGLQRRPAGAARRLAALGHADQPLRPAARLH